MVLRGYLAARTDAEHYRSEWNGEMCKIEGLHEIELREVRDILTEHGLTQQQARDVANALAKDGPRWVRFMMRFELRLEAPDPFRAFRSAATIDRALRQSFPVASGLGRVDGFDQDEHASQ